MLYYKITAEIADTANIDITTDEQEERRKAAFIRDESNIFNNSAERFIFVFNICRNKCYLGAICEKPLEADSVCEYLDCINVNHAEITVSETTLEDTLSNLGSSNWNNFIDNNDVIIERFGLGQLSGINQRKYREHIFEEVKDISEAAAISERILSTSLNEEAERIFHADSCFNFIGHPVHYIIETDDKDFFKKTADTLLGCLLHAGRIQSRRYTSISIGNTREERLTSIYRFASGGTVTVDMIHDSLEDSNYSTGIMENIGIAADLMKRNQNSVLTIFRLPKACNKLKEILFSKLNNCTFVEITEDIVYGDRAKGYLRDKAREHNIKPDRSLYREIADSKTGHTPMQLNCIFDRWLSKVLKTKIYPQYAALESVNIQIAEKEAVGSAYDELQQMIGLDNAKTMIDEALGFYKAQKLFRDKGITEDHPSMHMVFTGNPGTAKTTAARLFAQIMKDNGLLSEGRLYEVGRADLVGKYVGWTANMVKNFFTQAKGSVLFIDEAYSLIDDKSGMYGDEAINTIVQEMENHREDIIVIFAGYPDKMEEFLSRNPGLRSRIAHHIHFDDYSAEELYRITQLIAEKKGMQLSHDVKDRLMPILDTARLQEDFGNGRYARNLVEKAKVKQASRLIRMNYDDVTKDTVITLTPEDFEIPTVQPSKQTSIGFI